MRGIRREQHSLRIPLKHKETESRRVVDQYQHRLVGKGQLIGVLRAKLSRAHVGGGVNLAVPPGGHRGGEVCLRTVRSSVRAASSLAVMSLKSSMRMRSVFCQLGS